MHVLFVIWKSFLSLVFPHYHIIYSLQTIMNSFVGRHQYAIWYDKLIRNLKYMACMTFVYDVIMSVFILMQVWMIMHFQRVLPRVKESFITQTNFMVHCNNFVLVIVECMYYIIEWLQLILSFSFTDTVLYNVFYSESHKKTLRPSKSLGSRLRNRMWHFHKWSPYLSV